MFSCSEAYLFAEMMKSHWVFGSCHRTVLSVLASGVHHSPLCEVQQLLSVSSHQHLLLVSECALPWRV